MRRSPFSAFSVVPFVAVALLIPSPPARADIPAGCDAAGSMITCAAADVGKPCQGGGKCFEIPCVAGATTIGKVYKCAACPTIVAAPSGTCTISNMGAPCGAGDGGTGTCGAIASYCNSSPSADKFVCQKPSTETPTGPPSGASAGGSGGCDVSPFGDPTFVGVVLVVVAGVIFAVIALIRRRRRR